PDGDEERRQTHPQDWQRPSLRTVGLTRRRSPAIAGRHPQPVWRACTTDDGAAGRSRKADPRGRARAGTNHCATREEAQSRKVAQMTTRNISPRIVALSLSGAVHVVLVAAVLTLSPMPVEFATRVRDAGASSSQAQHSTSPRSTLSKNAVKTAHSTPGTVAAPATSWALVPEMVARAQRTQGDQILNHLWQSTLFAFLVGG